MYRRITFDKYEAALLIDASEKVLNNPKCRKETIENLSQALRRRAVNQGIQIDNSFRDVNGLSSQMAEAMYILTDGAKGKHSKNRLFIQMVSLKNKSSYEFEQILNEAKKQALDYNDILSAEQKDASNYESEPQNNLDAFIKWLNEITYKKHATDAIISAIEIASEYSLNRRFSKTSFWEIYDSKHFSIIFNRLKKNQIFRYVHRDIVPAFDYGAVQYIEFLKQRFIENKPSTSPSEGKAEETIVSTKSGVFEKISPQSNGITISKSDIKYDETIMNVSNELSYVDDSLEDVKAVEDLLYIALKEECKRNPFGATPAYLSGKVKISEKDVITFLSKVDWAKYQYGKFKISAEDSGKQLNYDFIGKPSLSFTKPVKATYFDQVVSQASSWRQLYIDLLKVIYDDYPHIIKINVGKAFAGSTTPLIENKEGSWRFHSPMEFAQGLYVETNRGARDILMNLKKILDLCNVDYENVLITYVRKQTHESIFKQKPKAAPVSTDRIQPQESDAMEESLRKTLDYLKIRYIVRLSYDHMSDPNSKRHDRLYKVNNGDKDIIWVYYLHSSKSHYISIETEPEYLNNTKNISEGFTSTILRDTHPRMKMKFDSFEKISDNLVKICDAIDSYFEPKSQASINDYSEPFDSYQERDTAAFTNKRNQRENVNRVNLYITQSLKYTKPFYCLCDNLELQDIGSWAELYTSLFSHLWKKHSDELSSYIGKCFVHGKRYDLLPHQSADRLMVRPKHIGKDIYGSDVYLETNLSADNIVSRLKNILRLCSIPYDSVEIRYTTKKENSKVRITQEPKGSHRNNITDNGEYIGNDGFIAWMMQSTKLHMTTARRYRSAINTCDLYAQTNGLYNGSLLTCSGYEEFILKYSALVENNGFRKTSEEKHNYLMAALNKYRDYIVELSGGDIPSTAPISTVSDYSVVSNPPISSELTGRCGTILSDEFEEGYQLGDYMHRMRFLSEYEERYGEELDQEPDVLLKHIGQVRDGRIFISNNTDESVLSIIYDDLTEAFESGATAVYYDCLFEKYSDRLASEMSIYHSDTLKTVMQNDGKISSKYRLLKANVAMYGKNPNPNYEVRMLMQGSHLPMTYDEIKVQLWYIPMEQIKWSLVHDPDCVRVDEGTYFYAPNFYISTDEKLALINAMRSVISSKGYLVAKDLRDVFRIACPSAAMDSEHYKDHAIREILGVLLQDRFTFSTSGVTEKGTSLDYGQIFRDYADQREQLTLAELDALKDELGLTVIYWDDVFAEMIRINKTEMVRKGTVRFDVEATDLALEEMCPDEYTPIKDFNLFLTLPPASVRWNGFLLESYLREYSKKFRLVQLSIAKDDYYGLMVKRKSPLIKYDDIVADMLAKDHSWSDESSAIRLLVSRKFQQRAIKKNIGVLIQRAKQIRNKLE